MIPKKVKRKAFAKARDLALEEVGMPDWAPGNGEEVIFANLCGRCGGAIVSSGAVLVTIEDDSLRPVINTAVVLCRCGGLVPLRALPDRKTAEAFLAALTLEKAKAGVLR